MGFLDRFSPETKLQQRAQALREDPYKAIERFKHAMEIRQETELQEPLSLSK